MIGTLPTELGSQNYGGVTRVVWNLSNKLNEKGFDITVAGIGKYFRQYQKINGIEIYGIGFSIIAILKTIYIFLTSNIRYSSFSPRHLIKLFYSIYFLLFVKNKIDFDVIHVHHIVNQIPYAVTLIGLDVKVISTIHSYTSLVNGEYPKEKRNINIHLQHLDYIIHVSKHLRDVGKELGVKWKCNEKVIYNGINFSTNNTSKEETTNKICFVGSVVKDKGIDKLLSSLDYIDFNEDIELVVVGEGKYKKVIKDNIEKYKYSVTLTGQLSHDRAIETMANSSLLVNPSKSESFGLVYLEALSVGTPVVGFKKIIGEFKEFLDLEENHLKNWMIEYDYSTDSTEMLAEKNLAGLQVKKSKNVKTEKQKIMEEVKRKFGWDKVAIDYANVYNEL
jgi:glycosyltransferase involved in cell wall biosynthesis